MPKIPPNAVNSPRRSNRTFRISLWIIGGLALAQFAAITFAVVRKDFGNRDLADRRPDPRYALASSTSAPAGFPEMKRMFDTTGWEPAPAQPSIETTTEASTLTDPEVREKVEMARLMRDDGDVQTALEYFHSANQLLPGNPEILYEIASCYNQLDLADKASDAWMELRNLGPDRGGEFYNFAELALIGSQDGGPAPRRLITLSNHHLHPHPNETTGEMFTLRTSIKALPKAEVDHTRVQLRVLFFDLVDGRHVARGLHDGDYPRRAVTEPLDWQDNPREEIIDFAYFRSYEQQQPTGEQREFYGFVAELYYDNERQDLVADPRTLLAEDAYTESFATSPMRDPDGPRFENSLFPRP